MESIRKRHIADLLSTLILENPDFTAVELVRSVLRVKNFKNKKGYKSFNMSATDEEFSIALENTVRELKNQK
jgi:hypothetical protein|tara:strand:+ start:282 stop:497 length:216 start_codon:yes stop_codon:yes gene_type:complete